MPGKADTAGPDPRIGAITLLDRTGSAPLRFRGRRVSRHASAHGSDHLELGLWICEGGGVVVAFDVGTAGGRACDARRLADVTEAIAFVESLSLPERPMDARGRNGCGAKRDVLRLARTLSERSRRAALAARWEDLVGEAVAEWEADPR